MKTIGRHTLSAVILLALTATGHLAYMGATPILATDFLSMVEQRVDQKSPTWEFNSQMWQSWDSRLSV